MGRGQDGTYIIIAEELEFSNFTFKPNNTICFRVPPVWESGPAATGWATTARESSPASAVTAGNYTCDGHVTRAANDPSVLTITEKAPTRAWLKASTIGFTFKTMC